jgi:SAM-dependent methyltransferase
MISEAKKFNRRGERCTYVQNDRPDLALFQDSFFDFIYTNIVLQHMRPEYSKAYLKEFLRVLTPGGLLVFQIPSEMRGPADSSMPRSAAIEPLPPSAFRASCVSRSNSVRVLPGQGFIAPVTVTNQSPVHWPAMGTADGSFQIFVGNHWLSSEGKMIVFDDGRCVPPYDVNPGQSFDIEFSLVAPEVPGEYVLEFDVGQERVTWFKDWGSPTLKLRVEVYVDRLPLSMRYPRLHATARTLHVLPFWRRLLNGSTPARAGNLRSVGRSFLRERYPRLHWAATQLRLLPLWRWLNNKSSIPRPRPVMEMYGTPPQEVTAWVEKCGGEMLHLEEDNSAGPYWRSQRYWATKTG